MRKIGLICLFFILAISFASAYSNVNIFVDESGNSLFLGQSDGQSVNGLPEGVSYADGRIRGETSELTGKSGETWSFSFSGEDIEMQVVLPEGARILNTNGEVSLYDNQISVYAANSIEIEYTLGEVSNSNVFLIVVIVIIILVLVYLAYRLTKKRKPSNIKDIENILNKRERLIVRKLRETGKIKSSYLKKKLEMPKASFSRHVRELEKKRLVKISGEGRNKFLELSGSI